MRTLILAIIPVVTLACAGSLSAQTGAGGRNSNSGTNSTDNRYNVEAVKYNAELGNPTALNQLAVWYYTGQNMPQDLDKAYELWLRAAYLQNPKSISNLGVCYQYGIGVEPDSLTAMRLYVAAIDNGQNELLGQRQAKLGTNAFDGMLVGTCHQYGIGTPVDMARAAKAYASAADLGSVDGMVAAARAYLAADKPQDALKYARYAAQGGSADGACLTGTMLIEGKGTVPFVSKGIDYLMQAADAGNVEAANRLADQLLAGAAGLGSDASRIAQWEHAAAQQGSSAAMINYARMLRRGVGVPVSYDQALFWLQRAAEIDNNDICEIECRDRSDAFPTYVQGINRLQAHDYKGAAKAFDAVAKAKVDDGKIMNALILADPANPKANPRKAAKELEHLAQSNGRAAYALAAMYESGNGVDRSAKRAVSLYQKAANSGYTPALDRLGDLYYEGSGVTADRGMAADFYYQAYLDRRLSLQGAQRLAEIYERGLYGVTADAARAQRLRSYTPAPAAGA